MEGRTCKRDGNNAPLQSNKSDHRPSLLFYFGIACAFLGATASMIVTKSLRMPDSLVGTLTVTIALVAGVGSVSLLFLMKRYQRDYILTACLWLWIYLAYAMLGGYLGAIGGWLWSLSPLWPKEFSRAETTASAIGFFAGMTLGITRAYHTRTAAKKGRV
jgi:hypothetical protein